MVTMIGNDRKRFEFPQIGVGIDVEMRNGKPIQVATRCSTKLFDENFDPSRWAYSKETPLIPEQASESRHDICNRLQIASMSLDILGQPINFEDSESVEQILEIAIDSLIRLEELSS